MTAVEWLLEQLDLGLSENGLKSLIKQVKEMEKQQIIDACNQIEFEDIDGMGIHETITKGEQYYNETFNK
jgi:hypothetical protein